MNADINPMKVVLVLMTEFVFGLGYNVLVAWAHEHRLFHVSVSVSLGVAGTLLIACAAWAISEMYFWQAGVLLVGCFVASGTPMITGSLRRTVSAKDNKKRRPLPNSAMRVRDDAVMELAAMAHEIAKQVKDDELTVRDLPDFVNRIHGVIGMLKSV